jgi:hypothetical protein
VLNGVVVLGWEERRGGEKEEGKKRKMEIRLDICISSTEHQLVVFAFP